jgi:hypothetical protein
VYYSNDCEWEAEAVAGAVGLAGRVRGGASVGAAGAAGHNLCAVER